MQFREVLEEYKTSRKGKHTAGCDAPVKSMFLHMKDMFLPCCFNKPYFLGKYPEQTITEIWNSSRAQELRERLENYDFLKVAEHA
jgi:MoaA/NifB/PqqE/SkfB family radical SAM enzyme